MVTWGTFSNYSGNGHSKLMFVQRHQETCLVMRDTSAISTRLGKAIGTLLELRQETEGHYRVATVILSFLSVFNKSQESASSEAQNSVCLSSCQRDVMPPVQMRRGPKAFYRVSKGD